MDTIEEFDKAIKEAEVEVQRQRYILINKFERVASTAKKAFKELCREIKV